MNRDYRGKYGQKADTAKPVWRPANHPKFNSKSEMKNVSIMLKNLVSHNRVQGWNHVS